MEIDDHLSESLIDFALSRRLYYLLVLSSSLILCNLDRKIIHNRSITLKTTIKLSSHKNIHTKKNQKEKYQSENQASLQQWCPYSIRKFVLKKWNFPVSDLNAYIWKDNREGRKEIHNNKECIISIIFRLSSVLVWKYFWYTK